MIPESISPVERQFLINQCKILYALGEDRDINERRIEILEKGYTGLYSKVFNSLYEEVPIGVYNEIENILNMYSNLNDSIKGLSDAEKELLNLASLEFEGFNEDSGMHYYMMSYLVDRMDEHAEYKGRELKAHNSSRMNKYNKMLKIHLDLKKSGNSKYAFNDLQKFVDAVKDEYDRKDFSSEEISTAVKN